MDLDPPWIGCVRALIYPIQFDRDPLAGVDRVMAHVVGRFAPRTTFATAIRAALQSDVALAGAIPQPHSEEAIRGYLAEVSRRIDQDEHHDL